MLIQEPQVHSLRILEVNDGEPTKDRLAHLLINKDIKLNYNKVIDQFVGEQPPAELYLN